MLYSLSVFALLVPQIAVHAAIISPPANAARDMRQGDWRELEARSEATSTHVVLKTKTLTWTSMVVETKLETKTTTKTETETISWSSSWKPAHSSNPAPSPARRGHVGSANPSDSNDTVLSPGATVAIAVAASLVVVAIIIVVFLFCRRRRQKKQKENGKSGSRRLDEIQPPPPPRMREVNRNRVSSRWGSMYDAQFQAYDYHAPFMLVNSDAGRPWSVTVPQRASYASYAATQGFESPLEGQVSPIPPPPPPKDTITSAVRETSKPKTPLRTAWRRATGGLKRGRTHRRGNGGLSSRSSSHASSDSGDSLPASLDVDHIPEQSLGQSSLGQVPRLSLHLPSQDEDTSGQSFVTTQEHVQDENTSEKEIDHLTHPIFRSGSFNSRIAPRSPKVPQANSFDFGFEGDSQLHTRTPSAAKEMGLSSLSEPDFGEPSTEWGTIDIASPFIPAENAYNRLANPVGSNSEEHLLRHVAAPATAPALGQQQRSTVEALPGNPGTMNSDGTSTTLGPDSGATAVAPATASPTGMEQRNANSFTLTTEMFIPPTTVVHPPTPSATANAPRPASSIYSEHAPSRAASINSTSTSSQAAVTRHSSRSPSIRTAQRGLRIQTGGRPKDHPPPPMPKAAREYEEALVWPLPLNVGSNPHNA